jgi:hypothetical protein
MPVPSGVNQALPAEVDQWFERACARDATQRFGSAKEMADDLHRRVTGCAPGQRFSGAHRDVAPASMEVASPLHPPDAI